MPSNTEITTSQLIRLIGMPDAPRIIDVRSADDLRRDPRVIPGAVNRDALAVETWADEFQANRSSYIARKAKSSVRELLPGSGTRQSKQRRLKVAMKPGSRQMLLWSTLSG